MVPRAQVDDANVAFAHAEHVARDDLVELELVELGLRDRLNAHGRPGISRASVSLPFCTWLASYVSIEPKLKTCRLNASAVSSR